MFGLRRNIPEMNTYAYKTRVGPLMCRNDLKGKKKKNCSNNSNNNSNNKEVHIF